VANAVNYLAVTRAMLRYRRHLRTGERIGWDKTAHSYPEQEVLAAYATRLVDLAPARGVVTAAELAPEVATPAWHRWPVDPVLARGAVVDHGETVGGFGAPRLE
jgi:hypothetical protein